MEGDALTSKMLASDTAHPGVLGIAHSHPIPEMLFVCAQRWVVLHFDAFRVLGNDRQILDPDF